jgi:hypothetical protein
MGPNPLTAPCFRLICRCNRCCDSQCTVNGAPKARCLVAPGRELLGRMVDLRRGSATASSNTVRLRNGWKAAQESREPGWRCQSRDGAVAKTNSILCTHTWSFE